VARGEGAKLNPGDIPLHGWRAGAPAREGSLGAPEVEADCREFCRIPSSLSGEVKSVGLNLLDNRSECGLESWAVLSRDFGEHVLETDFDEVPGTVLDKFARVVHTTLDGFNENGIIGCHCILALGYNEYKLVDFFSN